MPNVTPFPSSQSASASISMLLMTPLSAYRLTVEADPTRRHRLSLAIGATLVAILVFGVAWHDVDQRAAGSLAPFGFGRLAQMASAAGWSAAWLISALELGHYGVLCLSFAATVWSGATLRPIPLPNELLIFHRRQSRWVASTPALLALSGLGAGHFLAGYGLGLLAAMVEIVSISTLGGAVWQALVPEARLSLSVILDAKAGWGNRMILSGGIFRSRNRQTIIKDRLDTAEARDVGGLAFVMGSRTLNFVVMDHQGMKQALQVPGISPDPEIGVLAQILSTRFKLGVTRETLDRAQAVGRWPVELNDIIQGRL